MSLVATRACVAPAGKRRCHRRCCSSAQSVSSAATLQSHAERVTTRVAQKSRRRCGSHAPSPDADVARAENSLIPTQMWQGRARSPVLMLQSSTESRRRCGKHASAVLESRLGHLTHHGEHASGECDPRARRRTEPRSASYLLAHGSTLGTRKVL